MKLTPQFYLTADTHFGHERLPELSGRPKDFNELIIENWNKTITKRDKVLHLGDLAIGNKQEAISYCRTLRGKKKYLIRGNHDGHSDTWYLDCGFVIAEPIYKVFKDKYENLMPILFTHEPVQQLPEGWFNIHGHMHKFEHREFEWLTPRHYDVGVDSHNLSPIPLYKILDLFKSRRSSLKKRGSL